MSETPTSLQRVSASESWLSKNAGIHVDHGPSGIVVSLPPDLSRACHPLIPTSHIVQVDPNYRPMLKLVHLNEEEHTYPEQGKRSLTAKALNLLADSAGIQFLEPRVDYMGGAGVAFTARARRRGADGTWDERNASKVVRFAQLERKLRREREATMAKWSNAPTGDDREAELAKFVDDRMDHVDQVAETKAMSRVIRHWLAVKSTYAKGEVGSKPFLTLSWVLTPDYDSPHVRQIIEANFSGARSALYESPPARRQLPEPPDDDEPEPEEPPVLEGTIMPTADLSEPGASDENDDDYDPDFDPGLKEPAGPPRPDEVVTFNQGPYSGMPVDAVLEDPEGRAWVAELVAKARPSDRRTRLLKWLSWAERRDLGHGDCGQLARDLRANGDQFAG